jgi:hypothetical protein
VKKSSTSETEHFKTQQNDHKTKQTCNAALSESFPKAKAAV